MTRAVYALRIHQCLTAINSGVSGVFDPGNVLPVRFRGSKYYLFTAESLRRVERDPDFDLFSQSVSGALGMFAAILQYTVGSKYRHYKYKSAVIRQISSILPRGQPQRYSESSSYPRPVPGVKTVLEQGASSARPKYEFLNPFSSLCYPKNLPYS